MTCAWIETSSAETGSSQTISFGDTASARAMPMRWRWPPENSCGIAAHVVGLQADGLQQLDDALFELPPGRRQPMDDQRFADDRADGHARVERGERVLEDDLHVAAQRAQRAAGERRDDRCPRTRSRPGRLDQPQDAASGGRFAAAGFADEAQRLARGDLEADAVDRVHALDGAREQAALDREMLDQTGDFAAAVRHAASHHRDAGDLVARAPTSRSGGMARVQAVVAKRQRGAKRQPGGGSSRFGTTPAIASRRVFSPARSRRGIERIRPWV